MVVRLAIALALAVPPVAGGDIRLHPDDRVYARLMRFFLELPRGVEIPVIRDCERRLLELERPTDEVVDPVRAVEEGVFGMTMEMNEGHTLTYERQPQRRKRRHHGLLFGAHQDRGIGSNRTNVGYDAAKAGSFNELH